MTPGTANAAKHRSASPRNERHCRIGRRLHPGNWQHAEVGSQQNRLPIRCFEHNPIPVWVERRACSEKLPAAVSVSLDSTCSLMAMVNLEGLVYEFFQGGVTSFVPKRPYPEIRRDSDHVHRVQATVRFDMQDAERQAARAQLGRRGLAGRQRLNGQQEDLLLQLGLKFSSD
jgi:hypothetical protein